MNRVNFTRIISEFDFFDHWVRECLSELVRPIEDRVININNLTKVVHE